MNRKISIIGLGYVGFPVAVAFAQKSHVIAFDINAKRIEALNQDSDSTIVPIPAEAHQKARDAQAKGVFL